MKKYAIPCKKHEVEEVLNALKVVGFDGYAPKEDIFVDVNVEGDGVIDFGGKSAPIKAAQYYERKGAILLNPSYVIEHAAELDGAKKPWEIPPEGYRMVTDEERKIKPIPNDMVFGMSNAGIHDTWNDNFCSRNRFRADWNYAVPVDFKFEPEMCEITAQEAVRLLSEVKGMEVKIVK